MKVQYITSVRTSADALRAILPVPPTSALAQSVKRASHLLPLRDRWRYVPLALLLSLIGFALLFAGLVVRNDIIVAISWVLLFSAVALALRLAPSQLEAQILQTERECNKLTADYSAQCQSLAVGFSTEQRRALDTDAKSAIKSGASLADLGVEFASLASTFRSIEQEQTTLLDQQRTTLKQHREEFQRQRGVLQALQRKWKPQFFPARCRATARVALDALEKLANAACAEAQLQAIARAFQEMADTATSLQRAHDPALVQNQPASNGQPARDDMPCWLGTALPPVEAIEQEAQAKTEAYLSRIRESVLQASTTGQSPEEALANAVHEVFCNDPPGPKDLQAYVASLNGDTKILADRLFKEVAPLAPSRPAPGRPRYQKLFVFAAGGPNSAAFKAIKESAADDSVSIVGVEHAPSDLLLIKEERNVPMREVPEVAICLDAFHSLPPEQQASLVTACDPEDLVAYHPEAPDDPDRPARLLSCGLVLEALARSRNEEYLTEGKPFAKGFRDALENLRLDHRLASKLEANINQAISRDGIAAVIAKLDAAKAQAKAFVPKEFADDFRAALDEATVELHQHTNGVVPAR